MPPRRPAVVVVASALNPAGPLTVVHVDGESCTLSTGEVLVVRWEKLRALCEQICQDGCPIWIRTWTSRDGKELIELHRVGVPAGPATPTAPEVF